MKNNETPQIEVCANCGNDYREGDRYCRYCGAPLGRKEYIDEDFACIYGPPPVRRVHTCEQCGYSWETFLMIDKQCRCPKCGGEAPAADAEERDRDTEERDRDIEDRD